MLNNHQHATCNNAFENICDRILSQCLPTSWLMFCGFLMAENELKISIKEI